jgi:hypothetical protein
VRLRLSHGGQCVTDCGDTTAVAEKERSGCGRQAVRGKRGERGEAKRRGKRTCHGRS